MLRDANQEALEAVYWSQSPYTDWGRVNGVDADDLPIGSVVAARLGTFDDLPGVRQSLVALRRTFIRQSLIVLVGDLDPDPTLAIVRQAALVGMATAPTAEPPDPDTLRNYVMQAVHDSEWLLNWFRHACPPLHDDHAAMVQPLLSRRQSVATASRTRLQRKLSQKALPPPAAWRRLRRCVDCAVELQAHFQAPISTVASQLSYSEPSALSRQCMDVFGYRPRFIREHLGTAWLVAAWCERNRVPVSTLRRTETASVS